MTYDDAKSLDVTCTRNFLGSLAVRKLCCKVIQMLEKIIQDRVPELVTTGSCHLLSFVGSY